MSKVTLFIVGLLLSFNSYAACVAHCTPGVSYACGNGCVSIYRKCHKPTTSACNDGTGSTSKTYSNPKHVEPVDQSKSNGEQKK